MLTGQSERAVTELVEARRLQPGNANIENDLSVAYLQLGRARGERSLFAEAQRSADAALRAHPDLQQARFNRALAMEEGGRLDEALAAWRQLQAFEQDTGWRAEIDAHIARLATPR
jgi:Flp pilus assembly protein TadD